MSPVRLALTLVAAAALVPAASAQAVDLRLTGIDDERNRAGEERDRIRAAGDGATLDMTDRIGCHLVGAHCEELHGGPPASGHCEDAYGQARLHYRGRTTRFFIAGRRCPHGHADVERGVLVSRRGLVDYVMRTRWEAATGRRERMTIRLRSRGRTLRSAIQCSGCKFLVQVVRGTLPPHPTERAITDAVERACHYFPESYQALCQVVVEQHGRELIAEVLADREADDICQRVNACPARRRAAGRSACRAA